MSWLANRPSPLLFIPLILIATTLSLATPAEAVIHIGSPNTAALTNGLVAYWPLDGAVTDWKTGTTEDIIGGNTGHLIGMSTTTSPVAGKIGQALYFNGSNWVAMSSGSAFDFEYDQPFSIAFWVKRNSTSHHQDETICKQAFNTNFQGYCIIIDNVGGAISTPNTVEIQIINTYPSDLIDTWTVDSVVADTNWHHVVVTYDGSSDISGVTFYVDGILRPHGGGANSLNASIRTTSPLYIGSDASEGPAFLNGKLDDVRIYNRALGPDEIAQLYHLGQANSTNYVTPFRWSDRASAGSRFWFSITSSSAGTKLAAVALGGDIYTSANFGASWTDETGAGSRNWASITSSSDASKLAAVVFGGDIYTSTDSGVS